MCKERYGVCPSQTSWLMALISAARGARASSEGTKSVRAWADASIPAASAERSRRPAIRPTLANSRNPERVQAE